MPEDHPLGGSVDGGGFEQLLGQAVEEALEKEDVVSVGHGGQNERREGVQKSQILDEQELGDPQHHGGEGHGQHQKEQDLVGRRHFVPGEGVGAEGIDHQGRHHRQTAVDHGVARRISAGEDGIDDHEVVALQVLLDEHGAVVDDVEPLILLDGSIDHFHVDVHVPPGLVQGADGLVLFLQELDIPLLQFVRLGDHPQRCIVLVLQEFRVVILGNGRFRSRREPGEEGDLQLVGDGPVVILGKFLVIHHALGVAVLPFHEVAVVGKSGALEPHFGGAQRIDEGAQVRGLPQIVPGRFRSEADLVEALEAQIVGLVDVVDVLILFQQPRPVLVAQRDDPDVLGGDAGDHEILPVHLDLAGGGFGNGHADPGEILFLCAVDLVQSGKVLVLLLKIGAPLRLGGGIHVHEGKVHVFPDEGQPRLGEFRLGGGIPLRKGNIAPVDVGGAEKPVEVVEVSFHSGAQMGDEGPVQIDPAGLQIRQRVLELQDRLQKRRIVVRGNAAGGEKFHGKPQHAEVAVVGPALFVHVLDGAVLILQPRPVLPHGKGVHAHFVGHADDAPVVGFVPADPGDELPEVVVSFPGNDLRHGDVGDGADGFPEVGEHKVVLVVVLGQKVLLEEKTVVIHILGRNGEIVEVHIAFQ